ncbi:MAG: hypothetical protein RIC35_15145 [Marinoscillum sp.]
MKRFLEVAESQLVRLPKIYWIILYVVSSLFYSVFGMLLGREGEALPVLNNLSVIFLSWLGLNVIFFFIPMVISFALFKLMGEERFVKGFKSKK